MRVSESRRVVFIHVPKTGGSTLDEMIDREVPDARKVEGCSRHSSYADVLRADPRLAEFWSCGFVRNPWARMVSWWMMARRFGRHLEAGDPKRVEKMRSHPKVWGPLIQYRDSFERFVLEGTREVPRLARPQVRILSAGPRRVDFIGRTENFTADANAMRERFGLEPLPEFPRANATSHGHYSEYYDDATRRRVAEVFAADIEAFGYEFVSPQ
jgi:hypothetical protein